MMRAANDGVSAMIGPRGELVAVAPEYRRAVLRGTVVPRDGLSPYTRLGNWAVVCLALGALVAAWYRRGRAHHNGQVLQLELEQFRYGK